MFLKSLRNNRRIAFNLLIDSLTLIKYWVLIPAYSCIFGIVFAGICDLFSNFKNRGQKD